MHGGIFFSINFCYCSLFFYWSILITVAASGLRKGLKKILKFLYGILNSNQYYYLQVEDKSQISQMASPISQRVKGKKRKSISVSSFCLTYVVVQVLLFDKSEIYLLPVNNNIIRISCFK